MILHFLDRADKALFLFLNGLHLPGLDSFMQLLTERNTWIPFYAIFIVWLFFRQGKKAFFILFAVALLIFFCDRFSSGLCKPFFARPRPSHAEDLAGMVHLVAGRGGLYGFISSHAANTFGLATFLFLLLRRQWAHARLLFFWAFAVSYSRIYVGVHYPGDLLFGALSGVLWAHAVFWLYAGCPCGCGSSRRAGERRCYSSSSEGANTQEL